jgi:hypothetical protein
MLKTYDGISDLNFSIGHPLQVEDFGELKPVFVDPPIEQLTPVQTEQLALTLMQGNRRLMPEYLVNGSCDYSYAIAGEARFHVNIFRQRGIVMRKLQSAIPSLKSLNLPDIFAEIAKEKTGLVLVTGATGSGKTTSLATSSSPRSWEIICAPANRSRSANPKIAPSTRSSKPARPSVGPLSTSRSSALMKPARSARHSDTFRLEERQGHSCDRPDAEDARINNELDTGLRLDLPVTAFRKAASMNSDQENNSFDLGDRTALARIDHQQY